jgi:hypothetical protein
MDRLPSAVKSKDGRSATQSLQRVDAIRDDVDPGLATRRDRLTHGFLSQGGAVLGPSELERNYEIIRHGNPLAIERGELRSIAEGLAAYRARRRPCRGAASLRLKSSRDRR